MTSPVNIVLDHDAGVDDLFGLAIAALHPAGRLLAVSVAPGNVPVTEGVSYSQTVLDLAGRSEVPVLAGPAWQHDDGDGPSRESTRTFSTLRDVILASDGPTVLVATGALTNVAVLLQAFPAVTQKLSGIVVLGGAFHCPGNSSAMAERNVMVDPEAAAVVLASGVDVTLVPINVSGEFTVPLNIVAGLNRRATLLHDYLGALLAPYDAYYRRVFGTDRYPLHDPMAVLVALAPQWFELMRADVAIEVTGEYTRGVTVVDLRPEANLVNEESAVRIVRAAQLDSAWEEMALALGLPRSLVDGESDGGTVPGRRRVGEDSEPAPADAHLHRE